MTPVDAGPDALTTADLLELQRRMLLIRGFEERVAELYRDGLVPGFVHLSIGQEAAAVGACWPLRPDDVITSTHRGHGHCLAKGLDPLGMFAELMGRAEGTNRGRGGSMHIADPKLGIFGANGIVAAGLPIAVGAATAAQLRGNDGVAVAFFGDGAAAQGAFHEALNLAAVWHVPVVFFCENNGYSEFSAAAAQHAATLERRAAGYALPYTAVDGNDVVATASAMRDVVGGRPHRRSVRPSSRRPHYRWHGHYEGDPQRYRTPEELEEWQQRDPLVLHRHRLVEAGVERRRHRQRSSRPWPTSSTGPSTRARDLPPPSAVHPLRLRAPGHAPRSPSRPRRRPMRRSTAPWTPSAPRSSPSWRPTSASSSPASTWARAATCSASPAACASASASGSATRRSPRRPIVGLGVGAAMAGMRPVVEVMYLDFLGVCFDQLLNQAAKLPFMTGGAAEMALTVRTQFGAGRSSGSQHSQSLEALLAHIPGLTVVMPSTPADTYGLLRAAIQDPNPVVFIENRLLYGMKGPEPPADHLVPSGARPWCARAPTSPSCRCRAWCTRRWPPPRSWPPRASRWR